MTRMSPIPISLKTGLSDMATSQNGWKANDRSLIAQYTVPGTSIKVSLRKGDVSVVLLEFLRRYNLEVESLRQSDLGGYAERLIRGSSTTLSNHASGTAVDTRWRDHPLGARGTFTAHQKAALLNILKDFDGVLRWGGTYVNRADEMHTEVNAGTARVKAVADKIRKRRFPRPKYDLAPWTKGPKDVFKPYLNSTPPHYDTIEHVQRKLWSLFYVVGSFDGRYGATLQKALKSFQAAHHLEVDGILGKLTYEKLRSTY